MKFDAYYAWPNLSPEERPAPAGEEAAQSRWQDDPSHPIHDLVTLGYGACVVLITLGALLAASGAAVASWIALGLAATLGVPIGLTAAMMLIDSMSRPKP